MTRSRLAAALLLMAVLVGISLGFGIRRGASQDAAWPLATVPRDLLENGGTRLGPADVEEAQAAAATRAGAERLVLERNAGATVRETKLVDLSSTGDGATREGGGVERRLAWAVSITPAEGASCRGCASVMRDTAIARLRGGPAEPGSLTAEEWKIVNAEVDKQLAEYLAGVRDPYHVEFVDAKTLEWIGGAAGFRGPK